MSISDRLRDDPEYIAAFLELVQHEAEVARLDHAELAEAGFTVLEVVGTPQLLYQREGKTYTKDAALTEIRPTIEDKES